MAFPKIIHQTWRDAHPPTDKGDPQSWRDHNPDWQYRLWTDADLAALVQADFPHLAGMYHAYPNPVQRADLGRYCVLAKHGGVYADIDTDCLAPLAPLLDEDRVILCHEPVEHDEVARLRGLPFLVFNGTMASPAGHPFWTEVLELCRLMQGRSGHDVLETTGPLVLTAAVLRRATQDGNGISLNSCGLFNGQERTGKDSAALGAVEGDYGHLSLSRHNWQGSWFKPSGRRRLRARLSLQVHRVRNRLTRGERLDPVAEMARLDRRLIAAPLPATPEPRVTIAIPVRDAEPFLPRCLELVRQLDYPKDRLRIVFCEGGSRDATRSYIERLIAAPEPGLPQVVLIDAPETAPLPRNRRWAVAKQRVRRAGLAKVRNRLLNEAVASDDDWTLWIDADVCDYPADILRRLLAERAGIVVPNCVLDPGGASFDLNSFIDTDERSLDRLRFMVRGVYCPPAGLRTRLQLSDLRLFDRVGLHGVGGTMLLVATPLHAAGLRFPEAPYRGLLETEGFGRLACDAGVRPLGLPNVEIRHVRS